MGKLSEQCLGHGRSKVSALTAVGPCGAAPRQELGSRNSEVQRKGWACSSFQDSSPALLPPAQAGSLTAAVLNNGWANG